jgi:hypothetical protein
MKRAIVLFSIMVVAVVACVKKTDHVNCYICTGNDSVSSNIPALVSPHYKTSYGNRCAITESQKDFIIKENTKIDTLYNSNDTIRIEHWTMSCEINY